MATMIVLCVAALLVADVTCVQVDYFDYGALIVQTQKPTGEYLFDYNGNEMFHVDLDSKQVVWTLPDLEKHAGFDPLNAIQNINIMKLHLEEMMKNSKNTSATIIKPEVNVYMENSVVLGEPNVLICAVWNIFPPVMNMTWLKNGEKVDEGVSEIGFLPSQDFSFRKFLYLAFIPTATDIYTCEVEHWGFDRPERMLWYHDVSPSKSEASETMICALGLCVGFIGIIAGVILLIKGMRLSAQQRRRGN